MRKEGGTAPTDKAVNMFGLEIANLIAPARLPGHLNQQLDSNLEKEIDTPTRYNKKLKELSREIRQQKARRTNLKSPRKRIEYDTKHPRLVRLNLKGCRLNNFTFVNSDISGANREGTWIEKARMIGTNLATGFLYRANAEKSEWIVSDIHRADARGFRGEGSQWFQVDARYSNFNPAQENGSVGSERRYYEPTNFKSMKVKHTEYNKAEKRWAKATNNDFSYIRAQGADFTNSVWEQVNASHSIFSTHDPTPSSAVKGIEGYDERQFGLTGQPIWETIEDEKKITKFVNATWRNVDAQYSDFTGARMMNMHFPCEINTLDDVQYPRGYEVVRLPFIYKRLPQEPLALLRLVKEKLLKQGVKEMPLEHVEFQQPYLKLTDDILFEGAKLNNADWAGTCLNAVNKMNNTVESRLKFEGAFVDGADFSKAKPCSSLNTSTRYVP